CCRGTSPTSALVVTPNAWPRCFIKHAGSGASGYRVGRGRAMSPGRSSRRWWPCTHCHRLVLSTATSDREPTGTMKNRMLESRSFGSVRGEGSDVLAYSENLSFELPIGGRLHHGLIDDGEIPTREVLRGHGQFAGGKEPALAHVRRRTQRSQGCPRVAHGVG